MKKINLLFLSIICLCSLCAFADSPCDQEKTYTNKPACTKPCPKPCEQNPYTKTCASECFLCTNTNINSLFSQIGLSETQICTAMKIQEKYELEVLSLNERIQCEKQNLNLAKQRCAKYCEIMKQKRSIKKLEKEKKKICKNYECQFKSLLSDQQKKAYKKAIKK